MSVSMTTPNLQVRRATIEDLPKLAALWRQEDLPVQELEKRFKEFQVVEGAGGQLAAAVGLQVAGPEGRLHSEVFAHPEQADALRELLWERAQVVAQNHGLVRLWTQFSTPFWNHSGFRPAGAEVLAKLPPIFGGDPHPWQWLQLKEEASVPVSLDKEFALFREMERERTEKIFRQARVLKLVALVVVLVVFGLVAFLVLSWFRARGGRMFG
jgi:N-acetylglutamate synthase-like GNAT family acetyltransferase